MATICSISPNGTYMTPGAYELGSRSSMRKRQPAQKPHTPAPRQKVNPSSATATTATVAAGGGILSKVKSVWRFLLGEWAGDVGKAYHEAKKINVDTNIRNFNWGKAYNEYFEKKAAKEAAEKSATGAAKKGLFKKVGSWLGKKLGVIFTAVFFGPKIIKAFAQDGIIEGLKETVKAAVGLTAFALGGVVVGMMGFTGIGALVATLLVSGVFDMLSSKAANAVLGKSKSEEREELAQQQEQMNQQLQQSMTPQALAKNDPTMAYLNRRVFSNEPVNPLSFCSNYSTTGRTQYYA